ncbi:MAG: transposase, partial [Thiohalocapsa sp.]
DDVETRRDLDRLKLAINHLRDERLVQYLEAMRGHGRDDYPVRANWNALLAGIVFQHESPESLLRELTRNPSLMDACGFDPLPLQRKPKPRVVTDAETGLSRIELPPAPAPPSPRPPP